MEQLPKQLVIIGGGVIASEIASSMADLDVDVTILEKGDSILSSEIKEIRDHLSTYLKQQGVNIITNSETKKVNAKTLEIDGKDGPKEIPYETLLFATGRQPNVHVAKALNLEQNGKCLQVNEHYETSYAHVYAIGDLVPGYQCILQVHTVNMWQNILQANNQRRLIKKIYQDVFIQDWNLRQVYQNYKHKKRVMRLK